MPPEVSADEVHIVEPVDGSIDQFMNDIGIDAVIWPMASILAMGLVAFKIGRHFHRFREAKV